MAKPIHYDPPLNTLPRPEEPHAIHEKAERTPIHEEEYNGLGERVGRKLIGYKIAMYDERGQLTGYRTEGVSMTPTVRLQQREQQRRSETNPLHDLLETNSKLLQELIAVLKAPIRPIYDGKKIIGAQREGIVSATESERIEMLEANIKSLHAEIRELRAVTR